MKKLDDFSSPTSSGFTFRGFTIPPHMLEAFNRYIEKGDVPGDFLTAVITNDLREAIGRADDHNQVNLPHIPLSFTTRLLGSAGGHLRR